MLDKDELLHWCERLKLPPEARMIIEQVRTSDPARRVQSGSRNVSGTYPSKKMNVTIQFESPRVELAAVYELEHDPDVIEYYDQPPSFKLEYSGMNGRRLAVFHTPDYFAIRKDTAGWEECKTEEELEKLTEKNPYRYCRGEDGEWRCPPGEAYAEQFNFYYRVRTSKTTNWVFQRNIQFVEDYLRVDQPAVDNAAREALLAVVSAEPSIRLEEVFLKTDGVASRDDIYQLIATGELYVNLGAAPVVEPDQVRVFPNRETATAYEHIVEVSPNAMVNSPRFIDLAVGSTVDWNNRPWKIANVGDKMVSLLGENSAFTELPLSAFELLVKEGKISGVVTRAESCLNDEAAKILAEANEDDFRIANCRANLVCRRLRGEPLPDDNNVSERTLRYWVAQYKDMEAKYGNGYLGLLPHTRRRGPRGSKLPEATWELITDFIENDYETLKQKKKYEVWIVLKNFCDKRAVSRRAEYFVEHRTDLGIKLEAILLEDPPPALTQVTQRLGYKVSISLSRYYPKLCRAISRRYARHRKKQFENIRHQLQAALFEKPPPSLRAAASRSEYAPPYLRRQFPKICQAIVNRFAGFRKKSALERKARAKARMRQLALDLYAKEYIRPSDKSITRRTILPA